MTITGPGARTGAPGQAVVDAAMLVLERMGLTPADLLSAPMVASVGLEDAAAVVAPGQRDPHHGTPAGTGSNGRVDRVYLTRELADAASRHDQQDIGDSDHQALMLTLDGPRAARAVPPEPRQ
jgi:hypothetical protein